MVGHIRFVVTDGVLNGEVVAEIKSKCRSLHLECDVDESKGLLTSKYWFYVAGSDENLINMYKWLKFRGQVEF